MRVAFFSAKPYDIASFDAANAGGTARHELVHFVDRLRLDTVSLAEGADAVCTFVNDPLDAPVLAALAERGVRAVALRCAGFNQVDLAAADALGVAVVRVPAYSPHAVAEHTLALILALNRRIHRAWPRVRDGNFALDGLVGFDLAGKTVGVVGTGRIGAIVARLLWHLRCDVLAFDPFEDAGLVELGVRYTALEELLERSWVVTLNCPLTPATHHLVDAAALARMRPGAMLVNTGRGGLLDTAAVVAALRDGRLGSFAADVYEEEAELFFEDRSGEVLRDDVFARLLSFPNVLVTAHQAFLTEEALAAIASTTLANLDDLEAGRPCPNALHVG